MKAKEGSHRHYLPGMGHDRLFPIYDPLHRLLGLGSAHRQLVDQAEVRPDHRVLEIGCGTGNLALLAKRLHPRAEVVGLDPDPKALARAGRKAEREALPVRLDRGFAEELPYPDASFDRVLSALMFHHLGPEEKVETLREVRRVLAPGGSLHLLDFGDENSHPDGVVACLFNRSETLRDNLGDRIPTLMREAGFADPTQVAQRVTMVGSFAYYRATVPPGEAGPARPVGRPPRARRGRQTR